MEAVGDADIRGDHSGGDFHEFANLGGFFPVLGFVGNRIGWVRDRAERGENVGGYRTKAALILNFRFTIYELRVLI